MIRYYYTYTRPKKTDNRYSDPDHSVFEAEDLIITETPFGDGSTFVCYIESDLAKINGILNSMSEFNWKKFKDIDDATQWCNNNIEHGENPFTNDGEKIVDNRPLDVLA